MGGPLLYEEIEDIYIKYPQYANTKIFVETGTYKGETTRMASKYFDRVYTFEIVESLYNESIETGKKEGCENITYFLGDSVDGLNKMFEDKIKFSDSSLYFIDAHISGSDSGYNGKQLVPLMEELEVILTHSSTHSKNIFIIDDARFYIGKQENKPSDWKHISTDTITELFKKHNVPIFTSYIKNDRYIILTK